ncbi:topology modulation protein [Rubritalea sp.]|uniref:topology modulation protein n=1 Tax=Rubritalea sp. TaxID=2109375 RepID=UPI003EF5030F
MQRISILGCPGAGKSTLSRQLSDIFHLPVIHIDKEFWNEGWTPSDQDEFRLRMKSIYETPTWIIDGHYYSTLAERLAHTEVVYHLDYPTHICLFRALKRIITSYGQVREDIAEGCPERLDFEFITYLLRFKKSFRESTLSLIRENPNLTVHTFKHPRELRSHINQLS